MATIDDESGAALTGEDGSSTLDLESPTVNVNGLTAAVSVAAPAGTASASVAGAVALVTVAAPDGIAGSSAPGSTAGAVANVSVVAHMGAAGSSGQYYTENLCPNPSFEYDLTGYSALTGTTISQETKQAFSGRASMKVVTDGSVPGEGFVGPQVPVPAAGGTGSMSFYILGSTGTFTVSAISGTTATVIAQTQVTLAGGNYLRVILSDMTLTGGQDWYLVVQTTTAQALTFWIDAVQYEMNTSPHAYIDGSYLNCHWEGTPWESASYQPYQFVTSANGGMFLEGRASPVSVGEIFTTSAEGTMKLSGTESGTVVVSPFGALSDFGIWTAADMDPAVSYASWSNALASTGQTSWNRNYMLAYPPVTTLGSGGTVLWKRAAYAAVGFDFKAMPSNNQQSLADVQFERMPLVPGSSPSPTGWVSPRNVSATIKPTRLNFCPNPSIEVSTAGWTATGAATLSQDSSTAEQGTYSLKVTVHQANDGCYIMIPDLVVGDTYIVSAQVQGGPGLEDVTLSCSGAQASSSQLGVPYGGNAILGIGYGQGPYGGIQASGADMPTGQWFNPNAVFTAQASTVCLSFQIIAGSDVSYPTEFWVDAVLVELGDTLGTYFDGGWGTDYSWESGGTAGLTRSYYYDRAEVAAGAVATALAGHTPLGIVAAAPAYSLPYTQ